jgi:hypothetical protein
MHWLQFLVQTPTLSTLLLFYCWQRAKNMVDGCILYLVITLVAACCMYMQYPAAGMI